jgi:hypothetical protein
MLESWQRNPRIPETAGMNTNSEREHVHRRSNANSGKEVDPGRDSEILAEADELDLGDQRAFGPEEGFGRLWRKIHRIRLTGSSASPERVISDWKAHFGEFWPGDNRFFGAITALQPGELAVISLEMPATVTLSSGVILTESHPRGFTLVTPKGHMLAGCLQFSADADAGLTTANVDMRIRAADPLFEIGMVLFGHRRENRFWEQTLRNLAAWYHVSGELQTRVICEDRTYQWSRARNILHNGAIRNGLVRARLHGRNAIRKIATVIRR